MSKQEKISNDIFGWPMWKNKHKISYCQKCDRVILIYSCCKNTSCNCGGCEKCLNDPIVKEFDSAKHNVKSYLGDEEFKIYYKGQRLKKYIQESLGVKKKLIGKRY